MPGSRLSNSGSFSDATGAQRVRQVAGWPLAGLAGAAWQALHQFRELIDRQEVPQPDLEITPKMQRLVSSTSAPRKRQAGQQR